VVNQDVTHRSAGYSEEVASIPPPNLGAVHQVDVGLVDQALRIQRVIGPLTHQMVVRDRLKALVHGGEQVVEGLAVSGTPAF